MPIHCSLDLSTSQSHPLLLMWWNNWHIRNIDIFSWIRAWCVYIFLCDSKVVVIIDGMLWNYPIDILTSLCIFYLAFELAILSLLNWRIVITGMNPHFYTLPLLSLSNWRIVIIGTNYNLPLLSLSNWKIVFS